MNIVALVGRSTKDPDIRRGKRECQSREAGRQGRAIPGRVW